MECINHAGVAAAGNCQFCGKGLCPDCIGRFERPVCEPCLLAHNSGVARRLYFDLAVTVAIFLGVTICIYMNTPNIKTSTLLGLIAAGAYWGWQFLSRFTVPIVFTTGFGLMTYLFFKVMIAVCAGFIVAPWQIFRRIKELRTISTLKQHIKQGTA